MKKSEIKGSQWFMFKNIDCKCFGKRILRYHITNIVGLTRVKMQFKPGQEFREFIYGNGFGISLITFEGNKMFHIHRGKSSYFYLRSVIYLLVFRKKGNANDARVFWKRNGADG
jgi:hypothetical protein